MVVLAPVVAAAAAAVAEDGHIAFCEKPTSDTGRDASRRPGGKSRWPLRCAAPASVRDVSRSRISEDVAPTERALDDDRNGIEIIFAVASSSLQPVNFANANICVSKMQ